MRRQGIALAALAAALVAATPAGADPGAPVATWVPDGAVNALAVDGSTAYTVRAKPTDAAGNAGAARTVSLRIVR